MLLSLPCSDLFQDGKPRFLIKGGAYIELRLGMRARATKDVDTLFRGSFEANVIAHPHWQVDFAAYASEVGLEMSLKEGVDELNSWIMDIDKFR